MVRASLLDPQAKVIGFEKVLKKDDKNTFAAGQLRDLYQRHDMARKIVESHSDVHEENTDESNYCCYADYTDHSDSSYSSVKI